MAPTGIPDTELTRIVPERPCSARLLPLSKFDDPRMYHRVEIDEDGNVIRHIKD